MTDWELRSIAENQAEVRRRHEGNRLAWNEGAAHYTETLEEAIAFLRDGGSNLHPVERANLGDLRAWCSTAIHLQCASGKDTLSLWNEGAGRVVGVDISDVHIANARTMSAALSAPAEWYRCDILDTPHDLDGTADLLYTGRGALNWIQDIEGWAQVVARLLKPGGVVHIFDDHPVSWFFRQDTESLELEPGIDYFETAGASQGWPETYIGDLAIPREQQAFKYERLWPLASIVMALIHAGLTLDYLGEHRDAYWDAFPRLAPHEQQRIPQTFSLLARRPAPPL
ncbi:MAG: class I SAM-dependent methyltransferase [Chloroflexota bacterium]